MKPTHIILHCSDSTWGCAREINKWHVQRGWSGIGYHFVVLNGHLTPEHQILALDGSIECGRSPDVIGAHCLGYNEHSLGICLIGVKQFTVNQFNALKELLKELCITYSIPAQNVLGHGETDSGKAEGKTCPNFDVEAFRVWLRGRV